MIIDQMNVFTDNLAVRSNGHSATLELAPHMGTGDNVNITVIVTEAYTQGSSVIVTVQDSEDGVHFSGAGDFTLIGPYRAGFTQVFPMPYTVSRPYVRLAYNVMGSANAGKLFAAITRDHFAPYGDGLYIERGKKAE